MTQPAPPWALVAATGFALFQAWGWFEERYFVLSGALIALAATLIAVAINPNSQLAEVLAHVWAPALRANESTRRYRLRVACYWSAAGLLAVLALWLILRYVRDQQSVFAVTSILGLGLFVPAAIAMAAQSFLRGLLSGRRGSAPN